MRVLLPSVLTGRLRHQSSQDGYGGGGLCCPSTWGCLAASFWAGVLASPGCVTKCHGLGNLPSHRLGGWESEIKVWTGWFPLGPRPWLAGGHRLLVPVSQSPLLTETPILLAYRAHVTTSVHFNDLLKGPFSSPHSQGPGVRASTYGFGGTEFSPSQLGTSFSGHSTNGDGVRWRGRGTVTVTPRFGVAWRRLLGSGLWSPSTGSPVTGARVPECHLALGHSSVCRSQPRRDRGFLRGRPSLSWGVCVC